MNEPRPIPRERWEVLSPYLERALEMEDGERTAWLDRVRGEDPALAADLITLLEERDAGRREGFLEGVAVPRTAQASLAGQVIGAYTLVAPLGQGGMGSVWVARRSDGRFEGEVAVKLLNAELVGRAGEERFKREGAILARLAHPHIARLLDAGVSDAGQPYLVLELVAGEHIVAHCDQGALPLDARVRLFLDVLAAVAHAHANLIVHRDIKPTNVLVGVEGRVKLLDFGIAKLLEGEVPGGATALTREGGRALTPEYAAPEQVTGEPVTTATDVYALGALLYVLLTGRHPVGGALRSPAELFKAIVGVEPPRMSAVAGEETAGVDTHHSARRSTTPERLRRALGGDLDTIVAKALKKNPRERYASVAAFGEDLQRYLQHEPIRARPDTLAYRGARFVRRNRGAVAAAAAVAAALVAGTAVATRQMVEARRQRDQARYQARRAEASSELMSLMLEELGPGGKPLTLDALLDRGVALLDRRYGADPKLTGQMMVQMARRYMDLERPDKQRALLDRAAAIAREAGDDEVLASALCSAVRVELDADQHERAVRALAEGKQALARAPGAGAQARVDCLRAEAGVQEGAGRPEEAVRVLGEARALLERAGETRVLTYTSVLNDLGGVFYGTGRLRESLEINAAVLEAFERNGRGGTVGYANVLHNRAVLYYMVGEVVESEAQARLARERVRGFPDLDDTTFAYTHARALSRLGRTSEAVELLRRVVDRADAQNSRFTGSRGRLELGQALLRERRFAEAEERLTAAEAMWTGDPGPNAGNLLLVRVLRAELALEQGQAGAAERWVDQARTAAQAPTARAPVHRFRLNRAAALVALARGDAAAGAAAAGDAAAIAEGVARDPAGSADVGEALLLRARAHLATGDAGAARPQLERAVTSLQRGLGPVHSLTRQARELLATAGPEKGPS